MEDRICSCVYIGLAGLEGKLENTISCGSILRNMVLLIGAIQKKETRGHEDSGNE